MLKRWITELSKNMPAHDASDAMEEKVIGCKKRQFAPEYSHKCYLTMLREEQAIGSYIDIEGLPSKIITKGSRKFIVQNIQSLHKVKGYKEETLYLAISLADRYLVNLVIRLETLPVDFESLAVACLVLAAKVE